MNRNRLKICSESEGVLFLLCFLLFLLFWGEKKGCCCCLFWVSCGWLCFALSLSLSICLSLYLFLSFYQYIIQKNKVAHPTLCFTFTSTPVLSPSSLPARLIEPHTHISSLHSCPQYGSFFLITPNPAFFSRTFTCSPFAPACPPVHVSLSVVLIIRAIHLLLSVARLSPVSQFFTFSRRWCLVSVVFSFAFLFHLHFYSFFFPFIVDLITLFFLYF